MFKIETLGTSSERKPNPSFNTGWHGKAVVALPEEE